MVIILAVVVSFYCHYHYTHISTAVDIAAAIVTVRATDIAVTNASPFASIDPSLLIPMCTMSCIDLVLLP